MEKSIQKFIIYLEEKEHKIQTQIQNDYSNRLKQHSPYIIDISELQKIAENELVIDYSSNGMANEMYTIAEILNVLKIPRNEWKNYRRIFMDFDEISILLEESGLKIQEKLDVICYLIEKNLDIYNDYSVVLDYNDLKQIKIKGMSQIEFKDFLSGKEFDNFLKTDIEKLTEEELQFRERLTEKMRTKKEENHAVIVQEAIKRHFIDKRNTYDENDLAITLKSFRIIGISQDICVTFAYSLRKEMKKRNKATMKEPEVKTTLKKEEKTISQREYNRIFREIQGLYDIQNHKVIKPLSLEEIIYLVSLLHKIKVQESEIIKCIRMINKAGYSIYENPLAQFTAYYSKMLQCSENKEVNDALNSIIDYMKELFVPESQRDYSFWKTEIAEELKNIMPILNQNYQFELEEGKKLVR